MSALIGDEWSGSCSGHLFLWKRISDTRWAGDCMDFSGLDAVEKNKSLTNTGNQTPDVQPVARLYTDWAIAASTIGIMSDNSK
jgi:hypothetical protein